MNGVKCAHSFSMCCTGWAGVAHYSFHVAAKSVGGWSLYSLFCDLVKIESRKFLRRPSWMLSQHHTLRVGWTAAPATPALSGMPWRTSSSSAMIQRRSARARTRSTFVLWDPTLPLLRPRCCAATLCNVQRLPSATPWDGARSRVDRAVIAKPSPP